MPNGSHHAFLHRLLDSMVILVALFAAVQLYDPMSLNPLYGVAALIGILLYLLVGQATHLYSSWRVYSFRQEISELAVVCAMVGAALVSLAFLTKTSEQFSRVVFGLWWVLSFGTLVLMRFAIRRLLRATRASGRNLRTLAIAGTGDCGRRVAERMLAADWLGFRLVGFYDDEAAPGAQPLIGHPASVRGGLASLVELARAGQVDYVCIALPLNRPEKAIELMRSLSDTTASVFLVPDFFIFEIAQARWTEIEGMPVVSVFDTPFLGVDGWLKRVEDLALLGLMLIPALPAMALIALGVRLTSRGPVLFRQRRYGLNGHVVEVIKFRTMTVLEDGESVLQARRADHRVTPFGAFLRRTSLDELPQLYNVLRGQMSVVGPRPHAVAHNEQYRKLVSGYMLRHKVKPGITGWAQVNGWRGETDTLDKMQKRVDCDLYYIRNWSMWLDLKIVLLTVLRGFAGKTAY